MSDERRPLDRNDYERVYAVLHALQLKAVHGEDRELWDILRDLHQENVGGGRVTPDDLIGDEAAAAEITHALIVMEMLMRGETTIRVGAGFSALQTVCAVPGCPNLTTTSLCLHHELEQSS